MSGRIVNVRPKPGFALDSSGGIVRSNVVPLRTNDNLINAMSGLGTSRDVRSANQYYLRLPLTHYEIAAAYRSGLMKKIIQIPALDMVREWRDWSGLDDDEAAAIYDEEKRLGLRQKVRQAEVLRGLGGGALIMGLPGKPSEPAPDNVARGKLAFVHVVSRWHLTFDELQDDATQDGHGEPAMWQMNTTAGQVSIHPSRVVPFRADCTASLAMPNTWGGAEAFWGESTVQQVLDAVQDNDTARAAFASLINKARLLRIGIPGLMDLIASGGTATVQARLAAVVMAESIHNATIYDAGDEEGKGGEKVDDVTYNFAGAKDVLNAYGEFVAAISDIPATRLLGRAPEGMNASGDSQQADWRKKVRAMQTLDLAPCLDRLDHYLLPSATGKKVDNASYDFAPLDTPGEKERADTFFTFTQGLEKLQATATIPDQAFARGVQSYMVEEGYLPELEDALAGMSDEERYGIVADPADPNELDSNADPISGGKEADPTSAGQGGSQQQPPRRAANDASPRSLYVSRKVENVGDLKAWAKLQGLPALQDELQVTIIYSRTPLDWIKAGNASEWGDKDGKLTIPSGGPRAVEPLGDRTAVLLFASSELYWRHKSIVEAGATHGYEDYQPHISLTGEPVDLKAVEPYQGKIVLGPEKFEEIHDEGV